jgi:hypothetical protein
MRSAARLSATIAAIVSALFPVVGTLILTALARPRMSSILNFDAHASLVFFSVILPEKCSNKKINNIVINNGLVKSNITKTTCFKETKKVLENTKDNK